MAIKLIKASTLTLLELFNNHFSSSLVNAAYIKTDQGVVRVDLQRHELSHHDENVMLWDTVDVDKMEMFEKSGDPLNNENLLIDMDENDYS